MLQEEDAEPRARSSRPATAPKPVARPAPSPQPPDPVRVGARFAHRTWRGTQGDGPPTVCVVTSATPREVRFHKVGRGGGQVGREYRCQREEFGYVHLGAWRGSAGQ